MFQNEIPNCQKNKPPNQNPLMTLNSFFDMLKQNILFPSTKRHKILGLGSNYIWSAAVYKIEQQTVQ